jgi:DNA-directed RNA polymerase specialized sigma24 family protein
MKEYKWLEKVASHHKEWVKTVQKMGEYDFAEDIVQESYIALMKYADESKLIDVNGKVRKGYVLFTLRSLYYQFYNKKKKISKVSVDGCWGLFDDSNTEEHEAYNNICMLIDEEIKDWRDYDKLLFKLYRDSNFSMRDISAGTTISLSSIFHSIKGYKAILKKKLQQDYEDYINNDYSNIY